MAEVAEVAASLAELEEQGVLISGEQAELIPGPLHRRLVPIQEVAAVVEIQVMVQVQAVVRV